MYDFSVIQVQMKSDKIISLSSPFFLNDKILKKGHSKFNYLVTAGILTIGVSEVEK